MVFEKSILSLCNIAALFTLQYENKSKKVLNDILCYETA